MHIRKDQVGFIPEIQDYVNIRNLLIQFILSGSKDKHQKMVKRHS